MLLCLDIGNSNIFGGVFKDDQLQLSFRYPSNQVNTSDQIGLFLKGVLRENDLHATAVAHIAICSVVPHLNYSLRAACIKYFKKEPFILQVGVRTGLQVMTKHPRETGADRIANSIAATQLFPSTPLIVVDFGTATTFSAISAERHYWGGPILPGLRISMESLTQQTAMLSPVNIITTARCLGQTTASSIQAGLYFGQLGAVREIVKHLKTEAFQGANPTLIATGGFSQLFEKASLFTHIMPDLVLHGLRIALDKERMSKHKIKATQAL